MTPCAKDLMSTGLVTVGPDTPLIDANRLFVEEELHAAPVVADDGRLLGLISVSDLLRAVEEEHESPSAGRSYFRETLEFSGPDWSVSSADFQDRLAQLTVADAMQSSVVTVPEEAPVAQIAKSLRENKIHRVVVVRGEGPVGLVSSFDLLALLEGETR